MAHKIVLLDDDEFVLPKKAFIIILVMFTFLITAVCITAVTFLEANATKIYLLEEDLRIKTNDIETLKYNCNE